MYTTLGDLNLGALGRNLVSNPMVSAPFALGASYYLLNKYSPGTRTSKKMALSAIPAAVAGFGSYMVNNALNKP